MDSELNEILARDRGFRYMLLYRMKTDCEASVGNGYLSHLWGIDVETQITYMKALYNSFDGADIPVWLTMEEIEMYETELNKIKPI